jgi:uncharacterized protein YegJ (DUF2314 family)
MRKAEPMSSKGTAKGYAMLLDAAAAAQREYETTSGKPRSGHSLVDKAERDELELVALDDPMMAAAMRKARATLRDFLALAANPRPTMEGFAIKVAIREGCDSEYFWIHPFDLSGGVFSGRINNMPRSVRNVKIGDGITFTENEIVDWMYMDGPAMKGNYTARAMLNKASPEEREAFQKRFGLDPDL